MPKVTIRADATQVRAFPGEKRAGRLEEGVR